MRHELADRARHRFFQVRHGGEAEPSRCVGVEPHHLAEPGSAGVDQVELRVLARKVLVVQVQPVVGGQLVREHLVVPHLLERDAGVLQRDRDGVVPGRHVRRNIHRDLGRLFEGHRVHVVRFNVPANGGHLALLHRLYAHARERRVAPDRVPIGHEKRAAAVIEQPLGLDPRLHDPIGDAIGFEVVVLRVIHGDQQLGAHGVAREPRDGRPPVEQVAAEREPARLPQRRHERAAFHDPLPRPSAAARHDLGIAPLARSSSRRASGTTALPG